MGYLFRENTWYKLKLSFQLKEDLQLNEEEYLELWKNLGKALAVEGYVAGVDVKEIKNEDNIWR